MDYDILEIKIKLKSQKSTAGRFSIPEKIVKLIQFITATKTSRIFAT